MQPSLFTNWRSRSSSLGHLLTVETKITDKQLAEITILENERDTGKNIRGNKVSFTETKKEKLAYLISLRDAPDTLPKGVETHLDNIFRSKFWNRKRHITNKQMQKGNECETDSLQLLSDLDGVYYAENKNQFENDFITGEPDNYSFNIKEIKSSYDLESFEDAELTNLYKWQVRAYCWLCNKPDGELVYCLVNSPIKQLDKAIYWLKESFDDIDPSSNSEFIKKAKQIERNFIFDIEKWNRDYPNYVWHNTEFDFDIPKPLRVKRFHVELLPEHITFIKKRIKMAREYLIKKENAELEKIKSHSLEDYNKQIQIIKNRLKTAA